MFSLKNCSVHDNVVLETERTEREIYTCISCRANNIPVMMFRYCSQHFVRRTQSLAMTEWATLNLQYNFIIFIFIAGS